MGTQRHVHLTSSQGWPGTQRMVRAFPASAPVQVAAQQLTRSPSNPRYQLGMPKPSKLCSDASKRGNLKIFKCFTVVFGSLQSRPSKGFPDSCTSSIEKTNKLVEFYLSWIQTPADRGDFCSTMTEL